jgi:hypothetical protein
MTSTTKYYVMIPAAQSHNGESYWQELNGVKNLTEAQLYVDETFAGITEPKIGISINGWPKTIASKKIRNKWEIVGICK